MIAAADPTKELKTPYPVMGGKARVASAIWQRIGHDVDNAIEPFCYGASWMLRRPGGPGRVETINDSNAFVANFWRAIKADPEAVAAAADWPVNETDLHARHWHLVTSEQSQALRQRVRHDPDAFDARLAGWWAWGQCCWIGSGWCDTPAEGDRDDFAEQIPPLSRTTGQGVTAAAENKRPRLHGGQGVDPPGVLSGMAAQVEANKRFVVDDVARPQLADAFARGRGVHGNDKAELCADRRRWLVDWFSRLADRLRPVRVCCGDWSRVCDSDSTTTRLGTTGVMLDPPYRKLVNGKRNRSATIYANDRTQDVDKLCDDVQAYCLKWGENPAMRIALCGLAGEYPEIEAAGWSVLEWKSSGYGNRSDAGKANAKRERIWFSPHCLPAGGAAQATLF